MPDGRCQVRLAAAEAEQSQQRCPEEAGTAEDSLCADSAHLLPAPGARPGPWGAGRAGQGWAAAAAAAPSAASQLAQPRGSAGLSWLLLQPRRWDSVPVHPSISAALHTLQRAAQLPASIAIYTLLLKNSTLRFVSSL